MRSWFGVVAIGAACIVSACGSKSVCEEYTRWVEDSCVVAGGTSRNVGVAAIGCSSEAETSIRRSLDCAKVNREGACGEDFKKVAEFAACVAKRAEASSIAVVAPPARGATRPVHAVVQSGRAVVPSGRAPAPSARVVAQPGRATAAASKAPARASPRRS